MDGHNLNHIIYSLLGKMLSGDMPYLLGCIKLTAFRDEVGIYENDPHFVPFVAVSQAIYELPVDLNLHDWANTAQDVCPDEYLKVEMWAKELTLSHCRALFARYTP